MWSTLLSVATVVELVPNILVTSCQVWTFKGHGLLERLSSYFVYKVIGK